MNFRPIHVDQSNPISIVFELENALSRLEDLECFVEAAELSQRDAVERRRLALFIPQTQLLELVGGRNGKSRRILGEIELKVDLGFVQVAECIVPPASGLIELFTKPCEMLERSAVPAT